MAPDGVLSTILKAAENQSVVTIKMSSSEMQHMLSEMNTCFANDKDLKDQTITLTAEYNIFRGRAVKYIKDMKELARLAKEQYVPGLEEGLNERSLKVSKRMLADLSAHFEQVVQSFDDVAGKYEAAAECVGPAPENAAGSGSRLPRVGTSLLAVAWGGTMVTAACLGAEALTYVWATGGFGVVGAAYVFMMRGDNAQGQHQGWFEVFTYTMRKVQSIVSRHKEELRTINSSLKSAVGEPAVLQRLLDNWAGNGDGKRQLERARTQFGALGGKCLEFESDHLEA